MSESILKDEGKKILKVGVNNDLISLRLYCAIWELMKLGG